MFTILFRQGLLKVAIDNARAQEKQVQLEKTELKMELFRERELRETLEKQLAVEQKNRGNKKEIMTLSITLVLPSSSQNIKVESRLASTLKSIYDSIRWGVTLFFLSGLRDYRQE